VQRRVHNVESQDVQARPRLPSVSRRAPAPAPTLTPIHLWPLISDIGQLHVCDQAAAGNPLAQAAQRPRHRTSAPEVKPRRKHLAVRHNSISCCNKDVQHGSIFPHKKPTRPSRCREAPIGMNLNTTKRTPQPFASATTTDMTQPAGLTSYTSLLQLGCLSPCKAKPQRPNGQAGDQHKSCKYLL
jgi:hypothetical protein